MIEPENAPSAPGDVKKVAERGGRLRRWTRALLVNGALLLFSLLFAAVLAEVAIRIVAPQQLIMLRPDLWMPADTVGWLHHPNIDIRVNTGERTVRVLTDSAGFRVGEAGRSEDGQKILVLGDSFMEALQVEYDSSFPALLERALEDSLHRPLVIRDAGMGDWNPNQYLLRARTLMPREDYRLVITTIYVGNDIVPARVDRIPPRTRTTRHTFRLPRHLTRTEFVDATLKPFNDALEVHSHLFIFVKNRLETLRMRLGLHQMAFPPEFLKREATGPQWNVTADLCRDIRDLAARAGAQALFVLIPAPFQVDPESFASYVRGYGLDSNAIDLDQPNRLMTAAFTSRGLRFIDVLPQFREAGRSGVRLFGRVDPHLSPEGHKVMTQIVAPVAAGLLAR